MNNQNSRVMTKEQIEKKAKEIANYWQEPSDYNIARDAATEMAKWMLSHQWVSVEDELPPVDTNIKRKKRSVECVVICKEIAYTVKRIARYDYTACTWIDCVYKIDSVTHWMAIPPLAEEGGNNE